jgi:signal transduction histidine kinase
MRISSHIRSRPDYLENVKLLEEAPVPVLIADHRGEVLYANQLASRFLRDNGLPLMGRKIDDLFRIEGDAEHCLQIKSGEYRGRWFEAQIQKHADNPEYQVYFLKDLTEGRTWEESHRRLAAQASLNEALGDILHESNNWILPLVTYKDSVHPRLLELYRDLGPNFFPKESLARDIKLAGLFSESTEALSQLLQTSRGLMIGTPIPKSHFNLLPVVEKAVGFQNLLRKKHGVDLDIMIHSQQQVFGNEALVTSSLVQVIRNAYQAMPQGGLLQISARDLGNKVEISLSDSGSGIVPATLAKVFEPGFTTRPPARGFGLYLARRVIETLHGGAVHLESHPELGTTFRMLLLHSPQKPPSPSL